MADHSDYRDCYRGRLGTPEATPRALAAALLNGMPHYLLAALWLRDRIVAPFGLRTASGLSSATAALDAMTTYQEDDTVFTIGLEDRHLDFRVTLAKLPGGRFALSTWVRPHNALGRAYLRSVLPVHRLVMRGFASRLARPIGGLAA